jgi:predicted aconitase
MFAERLVSLGGRVRVPTTLNALSVDQQRWRRQGVNNEFGEAASALGDAYVAMGAVPSFTCAPYLLDSAPVQGEQIVWAESNAVAYANSVLGARTQKYPDFLDICIALTARAPKAGPHLDNGRLPTTQLHVCIDNNPAGKGINAAVLDDSFWPLLGYHIGAISCNDIPFIAGLDALSPTFDDHKAFSAAFATTSSVAMFHMDGHTPEASNPAIAAAVSALEPTMVEVDALIDSWHELNSATSEQVDLICLGNPHFSLSECSTLASLCSGRSKAPSVGVIVTLGRMTYERAAEAGYVEALEQFGVQFINDTCWCMIEEPVIPVNAKVLMTNSGKYAHYGPGLVQKAMYFASLQQCVDTACSGTYESNQPEWLN